MVRLVKDSKKNICPVGATFDGFGGTICGFGAAFDRRFVRGTGVLKDVTEIVRSFSAAISASSRSF